MFRQMLFAAAAMTMMSGGVAVAKDSRPPSADATAPSPKTRYCVKSEPVTGTILQPRICKTLEQWKALGVDPTKKPH